jgi:2-haloacid dehalogenase
LAGSPFCTGPPAAALQARAGFERQYFIDGRSCTAQCVSWDAILGAELAGDYKPKPRVYLAAADAFDLHPSECIMVAAHSNDLAAAAGAGLRTAHVARPDEKGKGRGESAPNVGVDFAAKDLGDLADKLDA